MGRPQVFGPETRTQIVLRILASGMNMARVPCKERVSEQVIGW